MTPLVSQAQLQSVPATHIARGTRGVLATVHPLATEAGMRAFREGGNAVDAAVAAALMLGVVDNHNSGIGGGCFVLLRTSTGKLVAIDGREMAPQAATRDMFLRNGKADPELSRMGPLAVGVPGALAAYELAVSKHGNLRLADHLRPAADRAEQGFAIDRVYAANLRATASRLQRFSGSREILLHADGSPYREGEVLLQQDLAETYRQIAGQGIGWFYEGAFSQRVGDWMSQHGGILTALDFKMYRARYRDPIVTTYRDYTIVGFPPPSSGGVHVAQMLNILEGFDVAGLYKRDPITWNHLLVETMKRAFADRAYWLGDADFARVPRGLVDKAYARRSAGSIDLQRATPVAKHGTPPEWQKHLFGPDRHTTHIAAADGAGNWVAITATVNTSFGSKVIVPGTGVALNNEMDDFSAQPGVPNAFGLVGAENNAVAPGKRPLSSMSPTIVLRDGRPVMTLGAAGGPKIITQVLCTLVRVLDLQQNLADAVAAPRFHHQWSPDVLSVEPGIPVETREALAGRRHLVMPLSSAARLQAIMLQADKASMTAVADPRVPGKASGF